MAPKPVIAATLATALAVAGCAQTPQQRQAHSKEYFSEAQYGRASRRVIADGQAVPRGGGQYLVGRPYQIAGRTYVPHETGVGFTQTGTASWYGDAFHGRLTANGEVYDKGSFTAASPTLPLPSYVRVTNLKNGHSMVVRVNDRGPYHGGRIMDVSSRVADALDFKRSGTGTIRMDYLGRAGLAGSDDRMLLASLRTDGRPATLDGRPDLGGGTMIAQSAPPPERPTPVATINPVVPVAQSVSPLQTLPAIRNASLPLTAPLPPSRPFDLGTIPGAGVPISAGRMRQAALFYAPDASLADRLERRGPFEHIDMTGLQPLNAPRKYPPAASSPH